MNVQLSQKNVAPAQTGPSALLLRHTWNRSFLLANIDAVAGTTSRSYLDLILENPAQATNEHFDAAVRVSIFLPRFT